MINSKNSPKMAEYRAIIDELRFELYPDIVLETKQSLYVFLMKPMTAGGVNILLSHELRGNGMNRVLDRLAATFGITAIYDSRENRTFFKRGVPAHWVALSASNSMRIRRMQAAAVLLVYGCLNNLFTNNQRRD